jgi:hypothetical protein
MESQSYHYTCTTRIKQGSIDFSYRPLIEIEVGGASESRTFKVAKGHPSHTPFAYYKIEYRNYVD